MKYLALVLATFMALNVHAAKKTNLETYEIDASHTFVMFKVSHLGFSNTFGRFTEVSGKFMIDEKNPKMNSIDLVINAKSIDTQDKKRDKHLRSPDFFNTKQFPKITFKSTKVARKKPGTYKVTGNLTMMGKTKAITFDFKRSRTGQDPWKNTRTGGDFQFTIKRSDFGMKYMLGENQIPDEVTLIGSVEGILKK